MKPAKGPRRQAREAALQVLFAAESGEASLSPAAIDKTYEQVLREFSLPHRALERAKQLLLGVGANLKTIDEAISAHTDRWRLERLARTDRNVLRIAAYELLFEPDTPKEVVIDEAIEIAQLFGSRESSAFVNGVLDAIARD